jgi:eukaryotic-like serine/threonine-protein kinase
MEMQRENAVSGNAGGRKPKSLFGYDVVDHIGQGAASQIYVVSHPDTKQLYALKHVVRRSEKDDRFIEQLEAEDEVGRSVVHPNLRRSIELKVNRTLLRKVTDAALVLELFDGQPLDVAWDRHPPRRLTSVVDCFEQVARALEAMAEAGFVHCDLKPANILINVGGRVKVIDLGQSCKTHTCKPRIQGTPDYIAPEQVKRIEVTPRTDVYNLGATMYWALTGQNIPTLYTAGRSDNSFLVDDRISTPRELNPRVPENLSNLVMECIRVNPAKRPANCGEVARRLEVIGFALAKAASAAAAAHPVQPAPLHARLAAV